MDPSDVRRLRSEGRELNAEATFSKDLMDNAFRLAVEKAVTKRMTGDGRKKENQSKMFSRVWITHKCLYRTILSDECAVSGTRVG